jgi:hypothetical protein
VVCRGKGEKSCRISRGGYQKERVKLVKDKA